MSNDSTFECRAWCDAETECSFEELAGSSKVANVGYEYMLEWLSLQDAQHEATLKATEWNQQKCPLLCLPAEIRNTIYKHVVGCGILYHVEDPTPKLASVAVLPRHGFRVYHLLQVCRQLCTEVKPLVYQLNTFYIRTSTLQQVLENTDPQLIAYITTVRMRLNISEATDLASVDKVSINIAQKVVDSFPGLKILQLYCNAGFVPLPSFASQIIVPSAILQWVKDKQWENCRRAASKILGGRNVEIVRVEENWM